MDAENEDRSDHAEQTLRTLLEGCSALRRDIVLTASRVDLASLERAIDRMIGRGEVETLRPLYASAHQPCYYRLRRVTDDRHRARRPRPLPAGRMIDAYEMGLA